MFLVSSTFEKLVRTNWLWVFTQLVCSNMINFVSLFIYISVYVQKRFIYTLLLRIRIKQQLTLNHRNLFFEMINKEFNEDNSNPHVVIWIVLTQFKTCMLKFCLHINSGSGFYIKNVSFIFWHLTFPFSWYGNLTKIAI